jgi:uncharacterized cupin superfamily protein
MDGPRQSTAIVIEDEMHSEKPIAVDALSVPPRQKLSGYPEPFRTMMAGREKRQLGALFGLTNFGVNLTKLAPGAMSSIMHRHSVQDEFIYILSGHPVLETDSGEVEMGPGMCAGFPALGIAHHLVNRTSADVVYIEIGDRTPEDSATYPRDDLVAALDASGEWKYTHKDGRAY